MKLSDFIYGSVPGDGACFFHGVAHILIMEGPSLVKKNETLNETNKRRDKFAKKLRRDCVHWLEDNLDYTIPQIGRTIRDEIQDEVNEILTQITDFKLIFETDGKNINTYITYGDEPWDLTLASGMEKFISSLAIRVGLINVSSLPRSNFLAIDEGFGTMDSDNLNSIYNLFQYLKSQFQFAMIVSHIDSMRDTVDTLLEVKKENGFSNIIFD